MNQTAAQLDVAADDTLGRAKVQDNEELRAYYKELEKNEASALWRVLNSIEPKFPTSRSIPTLWKYAKLRPLVLRATELVNPEDAARRVVTLINPALKQYSATCGWLFAGIQVMLPGEWASAHKHTLAAFRFIMEGSGGYTVVDGESIKFKPRDFLLTPNGAWHDHGNSEDAPDVAIWQDGLDFPMVHAFEAAFYTALPELRQKVTTPVNASRLTHGVAGLTPDGFKWDKAYSPLSYYPWDKSYEALTNYAKVTDGSPYDGVKMNFINPINGKSVMPTIGASMQMLRPGERTKAHRHTGSVIYHVAKGKGTSIVAGRRFDWEEKDIFCVPTWCLHEHANASSTEDAVLFSYNDFPVLQAMDLLREEKLEENGGHQVVLA